MCTTPFRLLIVDDHPVVLFGMRLLFRDHPRFTIVAEAATPAQARCLMEEHRPDFVVSDLVMGERDGNELIEDLIAIHPPARVLVYSSLDDRVHARPTLAAGARGYLCKTEGLDCVAEALNRIAAGEVVVSPAVQMSFVEACSGSDRTGSSFSARERQVLKRIGRGASLRIIASDLGLSVKTVGTYRERLKVKLGLDSLRALERYAENLLADQSGH